MEDYGTGGQYKIVYKNGWKGGRAVPKDVLYTHYEQVTNQVSICVTYNPLNKTLTGKDNKVCK